DNNGVHVDLGDAQTSLLRAGMAYEFHPDGLDMRNPDGDGRMFYGIFNVLENLAPRNGVVAQGETLSSKDDRTWGQAGVGGSLALGKNSMIYGQVTYLQSFTTMANNGVGGTIGVRINW
ncbi:MAG TPA: autotransporter outer membrane beta-barrel domain-containing protein, partial [Nevskiaceae bacterium]|nr:autotransporter outer membrane beta-barrel domain-containing protein [Nevskiaceae bacterium]